MWPKPAGNCDNDCSSLETQLQSSTIQQSIGTMQAAHLIQKYPFALGHGQREPAEPPQVVSITPLLKRLWPADVAADVTAAEIAAAISLIFTDRLSHVQTGALLTALHF